MSAKQHHSEVGNPHSEKQKPLCGRYLRNCGIAIVTPLEIEGEILYLTCVPFILALVGFLFKNFISTHGTSLVAQWLRIPLPVQGTWVRSLVREDPTCHGAAKPVCHNY